MNPMDSFSNNGLHSSQLRIAPAMDAAIQCGTLPLREILRINMALTHMIQ